MGMTVERELFGRDQLTVGYVRVDEDTYDVLVNGVFAGKVGKAWSRSGGWGWQVSGTPTAKSFFMTWTLRSRRDCVRTLIREYEHRTGEAPPWKDTLPYRPPEQVEIQELPGQISAHAEAHQSTDTQRPSDR